MNVFKLVAEKIVNPVCIEAVQDEIRKANKENPTGFSVAMATENHGILVGVARKLESLPVGEEFDRERRELENEMVMGTGSDLCYALGHKRLDYFADMLLK